MATFYNQATLSYNGTVTSSNITAGEIIEVLSADKYAVTPTYTTNSDLVYIISIINTGSSAVENVTITDDLGSYTFGEESTTVVPLTYNEGSASIYVNGVKQSAPTVTAFSALTITNITIPAGGNVLVVYSAKTNRYAPLGANASITNTAEISTNGQENITVSETVTADTAIDLAVTKSLSPAEVEENGEVTYTFVIQNYGINAVTAADDVVFTDTFIPALSSLTAVFNNTPWTAGTNYNYSETTGLFTSLTGQMTVPPAQFTQDPTTGEWSVQPGISTLTIKGII